jgi:transposase
MSRRSRRNQSPAFKAKVAWAAMRGRRTMSDLAEQFDVHPNQYSSWRDQLLEGATEVYGGAEKSESTVPTIDVTSLQAKIGELTLKNFPSQGLRGLRSRSLLL